MERVTFEFPNGKRAKFKVRLAKHLEKVGKGVILEEKPAEPVKASQSIVDEAKQVGIDLSKVEGSGKDGRILKRDLQTYKTRVLKAE